VCVCSLRYRACNAHAPFCHLLPGCLCVIFPQYVINVTNFGERLLNIKCVFWFSLQILCETFLILRITEQELIKIYFGLYVKYPLFFPDFKQTWIFSTNFRKILKYQIPWKSVEQEPSSLRAGGWTNGRTDRHDEPESLFAILRMLLNTVSLLRTRTSCILCYDCKFYC
jgi:hypothetical protein